MYTFAVEVWDDEAEKCTFYTVKQEGAELSETDDFFNRYDNINEFKEEVQELLSFVLSAIGDNHGAIDELFNRHENQVDGLPIQGNTKLGEFHYHFPNFPLRLYALKISENIVILFNGGIKDGKTNQTSSLHYQWVEACNYAKKIIAAINDGTIVVNNNSRKLELYDGSNEIIL